MTAHLAAMIEYNVNENVFVRLTDTGRRIHRDYWHPFSHDKYQPPETDADGWSKFQLWELMKMFGPHCVMGCPVPFETTIRLALREAPPNGE